MLKEKEVVDASNPLNWTTKIYSTERVSAMHSCMYCLSKFILTPFVKDFPFLFLCLEYSLIFENLLIIKTGLIMSSVFFY